MSTPLPNDISLNGLNYTRAQEGRALRAYQDSVGVWTIGYGLTNYDRNLPWKVGPGLTITEEQAEWHLVRSIRENYLPACRETLDGGTYSHPQGALDGAVDFHFNTGGVKKATWPKALARGDLAAAKASLMSWNKAGGNVLAGLTRRRAGNWLEMSAGDYGHLSGPAVVELNASNHEVIRGHGDVLTAFPRDPKDPEAGNVKIDGVPQPTTPAPGVLKLGSTGPDVTALQNKLNSVAISTVVTGTYDDQTFASVLAFQKAHPNLTADGKTGPATLAALDRAIALRGVTGKVVKTAVPVIPTVFIALHNWVGANAGLIALGVGLAAVVLVAGYFACRYRNEIRAQVNKLLGRSVI